MNNSEVKKEYTKESIQAELAECISIMDVPVNRKPITEHNVLWMLRNLGIKNSNHPKFERAMFCAKFVIKMIDK